VSTSGISEEVKRFVYEHIESVEQLEVLLLLRSTAPAEWTAESVARELRIAAPSAAIRLDDLASRDLLIVTGPSRSVYRYEPAGVDRDRVLRALADAYSTHRVSLITLIFSKPSDTIRSFADAFKIWKKDDHG
jgi:hypothetical protein